MNFHPTNLSLLQPRRPTVLEDFSGYLVAWILEIHDALGDTDPDRIHYVLNVERTNQALRQTL